MNTDFVFDALEAGQYQTQWQAPATLLWLNTGENTVSNCPKSLHQFYPSQCLTTTAVNFHPEQGDAAFDFLFDQKQPEFHPKIQQFLRIRPFFLLWSDIICRFPVTILFPTAVVLPPPPRPWRPWPFVSRIWKQFHSRLDGGSFLRKASFLARLGSGSAARSIAGPLTVWGHSRLFRIAMTTSPLRLLWNGIHFPQLSRHCFDCGQRTKRWAAPWPQTNAGPSFCESTLWTSPHPYRTTKNRTHHRRSGESHRPDRSRGPVLHAMMMTSNPRYVLMQPNTLSIIQKVEVLGHKPNCPSVLPSMPVPMYTCSILCKTAFP